MEDKLPSGPWITVAVTVVEPVHPFALVPVTVYVVVTLGVAITVAPLAIDNPSAGLHAYVFAPLAVNVTLLPLQNAAGVGTLNTGLGFTVTVLETWRVHPFALVTE